MIIGLGGTATTDGGAGMLQALGAQFDGVGRPVTGDGLASIRSVRLIDFDMRLREVEIIAATDVDNPLTGPSGAALVYGPQKGASPEQAARLDAGLAHFAALLGDPGDQPGDGAAGGLGYALRVVASAERVSGAGLVLDTVDFDARCADADLVITGEGRLDAQSLRGKVVHGVAARARALGIPVLALCGTMGPDVEALRELGLEGCHSLDADGTSREEAERNAAPLLEALSARVLRRRGR
jgi:glycerate kinase